MSRSQTFSGVSRHPCTAGRHRQQPLQYEYDEPGTACCLLKISSISLTSFYKTDKSLQVQTLISMQLPYPFLNYGHEGMFLKFVVRPYSIESKPHPPVSPKLHSHLVVSQTGLILLRVKKSSARPILSQILLLSHEAVNHQITQEQNHTLTPFQVSIDDSRHCCWCR